MVMTEQRGELGSSLQQRAPPQGPCSEQKMETLICAIHLHVRGVCVRLFVCVGLCFALCLRVCICEFGVLRMHVCACDVFY